MLGVRRAALITWSVKLKFPAFQEQTDSPDLPPESEYARGDVRFCGGFSGECAASEKG